MESAEVMELSHEALMVLIKISLPVMLVALTVGLIVSLFQALTQIQEMTLTFVPKIIAIFLSLLIFMPYMFEILNAFTIELFEHIAGGAM